MSEHARAVRAHQAQALARRMQDAPEAVQRLLQPRLQRLQADEGEADAASPPRLRARAPQKPATPLARLNQHIAGTTEPPGAVRPELRSAQAFRETWLRLSAEDEVAQAVQRAPENAGPLNSHMLVLRTLGLLRELSPDYLRRFLAQADTLLWLDQAGARLKAAPAAKARAGRQKK